MLSGHRSFDADTVADAIAAVVRGDPEWDRLPPDLEPELKRLLERCLEKDLRRRLRDIGEARVVIEDCLAEPGPVTTSAAPPPSDANVDALDGAAAKLEAAEELVARAGKLKAEKAAMKRRSREQGGARPGLGGRFAAAVALLIVGAAAGFLARTGEAPPELPLRKFVVPTTTVSQSGGEDLLHAGARRAWAGLRPGMACCGCATSTSWHRASFPRPRAPSSPFWSPDSRMIAYASGGRLWKVPVDGGQPQVIAELAGDFAGGDWDADDRIVFTITRDALYEVSANGGDPVVLLAPGEDEIDFHRPDILPGGSGVIFSVHHLDAVDTVAILSDDGYHDLFRIDDPPGLRNPQVVNNPTYSHSGHIVYRREKVNSGFGRYRFRCKAAPSWASTSWSRRREGCRRSPPTAR